MAMLTSEVRKIALAVAFQIYQGARGNLQHVSFTIGIDPEIGVNTLEDVKQIENYLISTEIIEHPWMGQDDLMFTLRGIRQIEASLNRPNEPAGPFPAMHVVIGDIGANAQLAIGSHHVSQSVRIGEHEALAKLLPLVQAVVAELPASAQAQGQASLDALKAEAGAQSPDPGFVKTLASKVLSLAGGVASSVASQQLENYLGS